MQAFITKQNDIAIIANVKELLVERIVVRTEYILYLERANLSKHICGKAQ